MSSRLTASMAVIVMARQSPGLGGMVPGNRQGCEPGAARYIDDVVLQPKFAQRALDLATEFVTKRSTFGEGLEDRQGVQFMLAECASQLYIARLMLMHIAYKAENGMDIRQENGIAKVYLANMVHDVVDTAIQLHGALGYSLDTPLAAWYTHIRSQRLVDGPDEVHKWITGKNVIRAFKKDGTTAAAAGGDLL